MKIWLWLACGGQVDPGLQRVDQALEAYAEGQAALEQQEPQDAIAAFQRAIELDPQSATLWLWLGKAQAQAGDHEAAIASADRALEIQSVFTEARYNRACWKAQAGQLESALADLERASADPTLDPILALTDPDLEPLRAHPQLSQLMPRGELPLEVEAPTAPVFLRGEWTWSLRAEHRAQDRLELQAPTAQAPMRLRKLVEDRVDQGAMVRTELRFSYTVTGAGEGSLGPWTVTAGPLSGQLEALPYELLGPEGSEAELHAMDYTLPSARLSGVEQSQRRGEEVLVVGLPGDRLEWGATEVVQLELREGGQPQQLGWIGTLPQSSTVRLLRGTRTVWEEEL